MTTILTHAVVDIALSRTLYHAETPRRQLWTDALCATLAIAPDFDVVSFKLGIAYAAHFGHRGFTHSIAFAAIASLVGLFLKPRNRTIPLFFLATLSHPLLDMCTNGGLGVALFAPFSWDRVFMPAFMRVIPVSPIGVKMSVIMVIFWECLMVWPLAGAAIFQSRLHSLKSKLVLWAIALAASLTSVLAH